MKKFIDRRLGGKKKAKSKGRESNPAPEQRAEGRPTTEARPTIGGHRARTPRTERERPVIGGHREQGQNAPSQGTTSEGGPRIGAHREAGPGFRRGLTPEGPRGPGGIGSHRAWTPGSAGQKARGGITIGSGRTSEKAGGGSEKAPVDVGALNTRKAPIHLPTTKRPSQDVAQDTPKSLGLDEPGMRGPRNVQEPVPLAEAPTTTSPTESPYQTMPLDNYGVESPYQTTSPTHDAPLSLYQTADAGDDGMTSPYATAGGANSPYHLVMDGNSGLYDENGGILFSTSTATESAKGEKLEEDPGATRGALIQRVKKAKAARLRAERAAEEARKRAEAQTKTPTEKAPEKKAPLEGLDQKVNQYQTLNPYQTAGGGEVESPYAVMSPYHLADEEPEYDPLSISSSTVASESILTDEMSFHSAEIDMLPALEGAPEQVPEVQERYEGSADPEVAALHASLRAGRKNLSDAPELIRNAKTNQVTHTIDIERERLSENEKTSEGWALLGMRTKHREDDLGKTDSKYPWQVKYAMSEFMELEESVANYIGAHMAFQREEFLCEVYAGKLVDVAGHHVDTTSGEVGGQAQRERLAKLHDRLAEARSKGLGDKVDKLEAKIQIAHKTPAKDKHIAGKFIYVMNSAGQFFATKPEQFKVHHSTMLASGAVACAGEIQVAGGVIKSISNMSGHYRPGPVFLWQAVKQLEMSGAPMGCTVDVVGVSRKFKTAHEFLGAMNPAADPKLFDGAYAAKVLNGEMGSM